ncbi:MAG: hypothetical protein U0T82_17355 [Bacteroidales bacterium]
MKNLKTDFAIILVVLLSFPILLTSGEKELAPKEDTKKASVASSPGTEYDFHEMNGEKLICQGETYNQYPSLDSIENTDFAELLRKIQKIDVKQSYTKVSYNPMSENLISFLNEQSKRINFSSYGYKDFCTRIDGELVTWAPVAQLPTNGKFIMLLLANWEKNAEEPPSTGFFLATFSLSGEMLSIVYAYGREEFIKNVKNDVNLSGIIGRAYCLSSNNIIIRKAIIWNRYSNRDGFRGHTLEIFENNYSINNSGYLIQGIETIIFPKQSVNWIDRKGISFSEESDTVKRMLGEIE